MKNAIITKIKNSSSSLRLNQLIDKKSPLIQVTGLLKDPQEIVLSQILNTSGLACIYTTDFNSTIERYIDSCQIIDLSYTYQDTLDILQKFHYTRVDTPQQKGEFAVKGDTLLLWGWLYESPIRFNFFGDDIESIENYDDLYGTSLNPLQMCVIGDSAKVNDVIDLEHVHLLHPSAKNVHPSRIVFSNKKSSSADIVKYDFSLPSLFFSNLSILKDDIEHKKENGWDIYITTHHQNQIPQELKVYLQTLDIHGGFLSQGLKIAVYTDREMFGSIFLSSQATEGGTHSKNYLSALEGEISLNDYLVHEDHGIGQYRGLEQKESLGEMKDFLILEYSHADTLYVPVNQLTKLTRYIGSGDIPPKLTRLGKKEWEKTKTKVYTSVRILATQLMKHLAIRATSTSRKMKPYPTLEKEFADDFEFEETKDQIRTIKEVLTDMESEKPMNRILVGDVGFGKTEVAMRAAFRAITNSSQVFILCPTTVLVSQHYQVFKQRFRNLPAEIRTLSRFNTPIENARIVEEINTGKCDIIIGTHRLLSSDIAVKNLGLLIIDEEQKFGVRQKEKIKQLEYGVHMLMMSATPIPRSLSTALSGLYEISLITTPPPGRKSIDTYLEPFSWKHTVKAITKELDRGGQVYFVHNNVQTIDSIASQLKDLIPDATIAVGHGQMHPSKLDSIMHDFYERKYDILIATTIIENGLDVPNVNTIIIHQAQNFGLAQLYQLRGRVGRSSRKSYCNLFYTNKGLFEKTPEEDIDDPKALALARQREHQKQAMRARLETMLESQDLGSGFTIASRDLEIRGAGNLLGNEQHGHISAIGFSLYSRLLADAVERIKHAQGETQVPPLL